MRMQMLVMQDAMSHTMSGYSSGIVRRIDDLGRVVIPKEIRKTLRIKEGTPLEL